MGDPLSVVTPLVSNVMQQAFSLMKEEFLLAKKVKEDITKLKSSLTTIQAVLEDAEEKQLSDPPLKDWLRKLKDAAFEADDILETFATEVVLQKRQQQARSFQPPLRRSTKFRCKLETAHKIKDISARFVEIDEEKKRFHLDVKIDPGKPEIRDRPHTSYFLDESDVVGREADRDEVINHLLSGDSNKCGHLTVIPIIGMGGLGKTTLAQQVYNDWRIKEHFESRMWVCVTIDFDLKRILKEMIEYHSKMKYDINLSESTLQSRLLEFLPSKPFLLVLDDVWTENLAEWESLQGILKQGGSGSIVLVTCRNKRVADIMGTQPPHLLPYLPDDECWKLFRRIAFKEGNSSGRACKDLEDIGLQIVRKCNGLPLAVKAIGGLLRGNVDKRKWQKILSNDIWEVEEQNSNIGMLKILPALKLSYYHLPPYLKQCFAYCSIFPKAYVFDKEELVKLWTVEAFIQPRGQERLEEIGHEYFDMLLERSFFHILNIDNKEKYRMHDLIHDLALSISSPYSCQVRDNKQCNASENSRYVSLLCTDVEQPALEIFDKSKKLRTLLLPSEYLKDFGLALDKIFQTSRYIRVLDLSSSTIIELPKSVEELKLLRYLDLSKTDIKMLPNSICNLYNLQILRLLGCPWLFELPKDLGKLINLRHLDLDEMFWYKSSELPPRMGSLTNLHNLHAFLVGRDSGYGIDELKGMAYLTGTLHISKLENAVNAREAKLNEKESLRKVVFEWSNIRDADPQEDAAQEGVLEDLQPHSNIEELQICHYRGSRLPLWMRDGLLQNLVRVSLINCTKCKLLSVGQVPHLRELYIKGMHDLDEWPDVQCLSLCRITISNCPKLRALPCLFPNLRVLKIKKCDSLKALPVAPSLQFLILIDNTVLEDWNEAMVKWVFVDDQGEHKVQLQHSFIKLLELKVVNCPKLQALPKIFAPQKLEISGCELMAALPLPEFAQRIQHMALDACADGNLLRTIPNTNSLYSLVISKISNLISLPRWPHLPGLKALYIHDCKDLTSLCEGEEGSLPSLTSLKLLSIQDCPKLVTLPDEGLPAALECLTIGSCPNLNSLGPKDMLKSLTSLKDFFIMDCPALQSLPEEGLSTSLQHLHIQGCPLLRERCQEKDGGGLDWHKIMHIPDLEIDSIKVCSSPDLPVNMPSKSSTSWYQFKFCRGKDSIKQVRHVAPSSSA